MHVPVWQRAGTEEGQCREHVFVRGLIKKVSLVQAQLREKQKQLESLVGELNMEQAKADEHRDAIARLQKEHVELKRLVLAAKKRERRLKGKKLKVVDPQEDVSCQQEDDQPDLNSTLNVGDIQEEASCAEISAAGDLKDVLAEAEQNVCA